MRILGFIVFLLDLYAIWNVITSSASTGKKVLWTLGILILPLLGLIAWYVWGPRGRGARI
ncbi:PLDc N-terminal domain-containing protein [Limimaricola pyoseonensis]|uniref:Phospholipase_D-nuclease N-terminal n=1 Tax=Limimaricola pyoseonensis TaxID=521013 RepID=A0A1G7G581_9RHOB|nr:PLDc N-terminal domain-containing protein [Limimaricola pyoseonensis]SDE83314.1 Phospholipase_D-nuclease N-terminal [Limimaricola pyoseonensis]